MSLHFIQLAHKVPLLGVTLIAKGNLVLCWLRPGRVTEVTVMINLPH